MSRIPSVTRLILPVTILLLLGAALGAAPTQAAGVVGNGTPGSCTEIAFQNALVGGGQISFNCGPNPLTIIISAQKSITAKTVINGGSKITLSANNNKHFQVFSGNVLKLKNIKLSDGNGSNGGSIENFGTVKTNNVTFFKNVATGVGGAIANYGKLVANNSFFTKNTATGDGGAIWNSAAGNTKINNTTLKGNKGLNGGAIANGESGGDLVVVNSRFIKNSANTGGAIWTEYDTSNSVRLSTFNKSKGDMGAGIANLGGMEIVGSLFANGVATSQGGGVWNGGFLSIDTTTFATNQAINGGAIRDFGNSFFMQRSTLRGNQASNHGGGVFSTGNDVGVQNVTLSGNTASQLGGGWYHSQGAVRFDFTTIASNNGIAGGGVYADETTTTTITFQNSVLSLNLGGNCGGDMIVSDGYNLSSDGNCAGSFTNTKDKNNKNAKLGLLANNGGPTLTHLPLAGSPLINKGLNNASILIDQRGLPRPVGPKSDIGSVEVQ